MDSYPSPIPIQYNWKIPMAEIKAKFAFYIKSANHSVLFDGSNLKTVDQNNGLKLQSSNLINRLWNRDDKGFTFIVGKENCVKTHALEHCFYENILPENIVDITTAEIVTKSVKLRDACLQYLLVFMKFPVPIEDFDDLDKDFAYHLLTKAFSPEQ
uniref:Uncharacterized protein n=1 Tax=Panagrolaimus sp. ES5 TaxID=591445 RepID=A0AC34F799_9BILA